MITSFRTIGLVFSARKGNCLDFARYILDDNEVLHLADYEISPCRNCKYECFNNKPCPINDDLSKIFTPLIKTEKILIVSPIYDSRPPALYYAFQERLPSMWIRKKEGFNLFKGKKVALIVVGNHGVQNTSQILYSNCQNYYMDIVNTLNIFPKEYLKGGGISGGLIENREVRDQLDEVRKKLL